MFYQSDGTWAWSLGAGTRRITYERESGQRMPLNDGRWHQLAMSYSSDLSEIRLYYDGVNWATYHVSDSNGFDFTSPEPVTMGAADPQGRGPDVLPGILEGAQGLQALVDAFNGLGLRPLGSDELLAVVVNPRRVFQERVDEQARRMVADSLSFRREMEAANWEPVAEAESALMANPYTVHQVMNFMETAPLRQIYALSNGRIEIKPEGASSHAARARLDQPEFEMDELVVWDRVLGPDEMAASYAVHRDSPSSATEEALGSLTAACWNIWHGGKHWTVAEHGWDSRLRIADMLREVGSDVVMMQETYSAGDFIAAELGFYYATTVDWDYLNQGSNISVMGRYPIQEVFVDEDFAVQQCGCQGDNHRLAGHLCDVQLVWDGAIPSVFEFHASRFEESDDIPTLFAGDFNAVPHTDGGESPASVRLLEAGFTDAYRSLYPDPATHPSPTHRNGRRIDQLYYRGRGLTNKDTRIISDHPLGFPSDHYLIVSDFDLDYATRPGGR